MEGAAGRECDFLSTFNELTAHSLVTAYLCQLHFAGGTVGGLAGHSANKGTIPERMTVWVNLSGCDAIC